MKNNEIVRTIGIDVHKDSYSLSTFNPQSGSFVAECTIAADPKSVVAYVDRLRKEMCVPVSIEVGYEAGPTGFGLKRGLEKAGIRCHVMGCQGCEDLGKGRLLGLLFRSRPPEQGG